MAQKINGLSRDFIIHPGETIAEVLDEKNMSQKELAIRCAYSEKHISTVISGQKNISPDFAKKLEYDEENRLTNAEYKKKKDRRKSIEHNAPSQFLSYLDTKLALLNLPAIHRIKIPEELYWYRHDKYNSDKSYLPEQEVMIQGVCINQTIYRAFLILNYNYKGKYYNDMSDSFDKFIEKL